MNLNLVIFLSNKIKLQKHVFITNMNLFSFYILLYFIDVDDIFFAFDSMLV